MWSKSRAAAILVLVPTVALAWVVRAQAPRDETKQERPSLSLRLSPRVGLAPLEVSATAELEGGSDNFEEYYCATIEWDWDDGTRSASSGDCEPYDPNVSEIRRRFTARHRYERGGRYRVAFNLKQNDEVVGRAVTSAQFSGGF
jgi:hypothetical protein